MRTKAPHFTLRKFYLFHFHNEIKAMSKHCVTSFICFKWLAKPPLLDVMFSFPFIWAWFLSLSTISLKLLSVQPDNHTRFTCGSFRLQLFLLFCRCKSPSTSLFSSRWGARLPSAHNTSSRNTDAPGGRIHLAAGNAVHFCKLYEQGGFYGERMVPQSQHHTILSIL